MGGVPYVYASLLDASMVDTLGAPGASPRATLALSEAALPSKPLSACHIGSFPFGECAAVPALYHLRPARPLGPPSFTTCVTFAVGGSPENPPCARLVLSGAVVKVTDASEEASAKAALFARHPVCRSAARTPDREAPDLLLTR